MVFGYLLVKQNASGGKGNSSLIYLIIDVKLIDLQQILFSICNKKLLRFASKVNYVIRTLHITNLRLFATVLHLLLL